MPAEFAIYTFAQIADWAFLPLVGNQSKRMETEFKARLERDALTTAAITKVPLCDTPM